MLGVVQDFNLLTSLIGRSFTAVSPPRAFSTQEAF